MLAHMFLFFTISAILLLFPDSALAWGAGTHLMLGKQVLDALARLPAAIAIIIDAHHRDFLYGCIAADIIVGKKFTKYHLNCHRWNIGLKVLAKAEHPGQKACAYGYLAHLAADTIAHNIYVPYKLMKSYPSLALKHAYWETRFDSYVGKDVWDTGHRIAQENYQENDRLLRSVLTETIFSFGTNKRIFNSILLVSRMEQWQQAIRTLDESSRFPLEDEDRGEYLSLATDAVLCCLQNPTGNKYLDIDPTGEHPLAAAEKVRKNLRLLYQSGKLSEQQATLHLDPIRDSLKKALWEPEILKTIVMR